LKTVTGWIIGFGILELFTIILISINVLTFILYLTDKHKAIRGKRRISESALIFFTLAFGGFGALLGMYTARHKTKRLHFKTSVTIGVIIALLPSVHIAYGLTLGRTVRYTQITFYSENWPPGLDAYRIAFMTDFHEISDTDIQKIAAKLNTKNLDLLLLGGDFYMRNEHYQGTLAAISAVTATDGTFGVEGNHDDHIRVFAAMEQFNIIPLNNNGLHIRDNFYLAGVHDLWNRTPDINAATAGAGSDDFILLLTHNPDITMTQPTEGIGLILAGHTHGGQITFFGIPFYLLRGSITHYGMHFSHGFSHSADGVPVYVSSGVGKYFNIPKIFVRPEVVIITIKSL
jgi:hypothetical protein